MKFFTLEAYNAVEDDDAPWSDDLMYKACIAYPLYIESIRDRLPASVYELAQPRGIEDGRVVRIKHDLSKKHLTFVLRSGNLIMGYYNLVLDYFGVTIEPEDDRLLARIARGQIDPEAGRKELMYHELDVIEGGRIKHRMLFRFPAVTLAIQCDQLEWKSIPKPNRKFRLARDRYPDGPET